MTICHPSPTTRYPPPATRHPSPVTRHPRKSPAVESTSSTKFKQRFSHCLASFRATIESVSQQTLRKAVYSQEFNKVNSVVGWKFRANLGQFCGRVRPHWKQIDVKRWGFIILGWNLQGLLHKVKEKCLKFLAIRENQFWNFLDTARMIMKLQGVTKKFHQYIKEKLTSNINAGSHAVKVKTI